MTHSADPRLKLAIALAALLLGISLPRAAPALALAGCALAALLLDAGPRRVPWRSLAAAWSLGAVAAALRMLLTPGDGLLSLPFPGHPLVLSQPGAAQGALLLSRVLAATLAGAWLTATTPFPRLLAALGWMRVPAALLEILRLAHRYQHVLGESLDTVRCAQSMRLGYRGWRRGLASAGVLVGAVACRALDQATATAEAMALRGDRGLSAVRLPPRTGSTDALVAGCATLVLVASATLGWGTPW